MKHTTVREAAARREPRTFKPLRPTASRASHTQDLVAPGFTRAQMRQMIIDQIG